LENNTVKVKQSRFNIGTSIICTRESKYKIAATPYSQGTWFVSGR
jgi:hypothetical protein